MCCSDVAELLIGDTLGYLQSGKEIAVKRILQNNRKVLHEVRNEVILIAKLQHEISLTSWDAVFKENEC